MVIQAPPLWMRSAGAPLTPSTLLDGLLSYWKLDGNALDSVGAADGSYTGTPSFGSGKVGNAAWLRGGFYITTPFVDALGDFTVNTWFRTVGGSFAERIVDKNFADGFWLGRDPNGTQVDFGGGVIQPSPPYGSFAPITDGAWFMSTLRRIGTTQTLFMNGVPFASIACPSTPLSATPLTIGATAAGAFLSGGDADEISVYNRGLTDNEVYQAWNRGTANSWPFTVPVFNPMEIGLAGYWKLNGDASTPVGPLAATLDGTVTFPPALFSELAADFTDALSSPSINLGRLPSFGTGDFTMACWATLDQPLPFYARWFCLADNGPSFWCDPAGVAGIVHANTVLGYFGHNISVGAPTHYAISVSQSGGSTTIRPYVNAVPKTPITVATPAWDVATVGTLGTRYGRTERFPGRVQRAGYWRRALSAGEILDLYNGSTYPFP